MQIARGTGFLGDSFNHKYLFDGSTGWQPILDRFEALGYRAHISEPYASLTRSDGIAISMQIVDADTQLLELMQDEFDAEGCNSPLEGNIYMDFTEVPVGPPE